MKLIHSLWNDDAGFIVSTELVLVSTLLVVGLVTALTALRDQFIAEITGLGQDFHSLRQSLAVPSIRDAQAQPTAWTGGSWYSDDKTQSRTDDTDQRKYGISLGVMQLTPLSIQFTPSSPQSSQGEN